jgi:hypothetical protein
MYGYPPGSKQRRMTRKKVSRAEVDETSAQDQKKQMLYTDVMQINGSRFF